MTDHCSNNMIRPICRCHVWVLSGALALFVSGCSLFETGTAEDRNTKADGQTVEVVTPPAEPVMHVTRDAQISLFGETAGRDRIPAPSMPAAPMKQHSFATEGADFDVDIANDGQRLVFSSTRHSVKPNIYIKSVEGRAVTQVTADPASDVQPCFSPDGKSIVFASDRAGNWDLWMVALNGGRPIQLTRSPAHEVHPSFAPDGQRLVFCTFNEMSQQWELQLLELNKPGTTRTIGVGLFPEWSPKGDSIVYQRARQRGGRWFSIWRMDLVGGEPAFPAEIAFSSEMALIQPSWSPDGKWVTYGTAEVPARLDPVSQGTLPASRGDIWIVQADGSSMLRLTSGAGAHFGSVWGNDGRIYFTSLATGTENLWSVRPMEARIVQGPVASKDKSASQSQEQVAGVRVAPVRDPGK